MNCARPDLWGAWLGNRWAYPEIRSYPAYDHVSLGRFETNLFQH